MGIEDIILLFSVGMLAGFFAGLIGIGGGLFYVLVYSYFLSKFDFYSEEEFVRMVIANSILSTFFAALSASIRHYRNGNFFSKPVLLIGSAGLVTSILGTFLISTYHFYNRDLFAIVITLVVIPLIWRMLSEQNTNNVSVNAIPPYKYSLIGLLSGLGTAFSGLGGAFIVTPFLNGLFGIDIKKVISISVGTIVLVAGGNTLFTLFTQEFNTQLPYTYSGINILMIIPVIIGVMLAAPFGVSVSKTVNPKIIRYSFLLFCIGIIFRNILEILN